MWSSRCRPRWPSWPWPTRPCSTTLLFQAAAATLRDVAANPKRLGAQVGVLMVLHTWGQNLHHHPHVHGVVTGGGLSCNAAATSMRRRAGVSCRPGFFLPVRVLSRVFRGKYLELAARGLRRRASCASPAGWRRWPTPAAFAAWLTAAVRQGLGGLRQAAVRRPGPGAEVPGPLHAPRGHQQLAGCVKLDDGRVTFRYKDYADDAPAQDDDARRPRSSCAASCSTSCPRAS